MKHLLLLLLAACSSLAWAGEEGGVDTSGGGNGIVCFKNPRIVARIKNEQKVSGVVKVLDSDLPSIESIEVLDLHQARNRLGFTTDAPTPNLIEPEKDESPESYAFRLINRMSEVAPSGIYVGLLASVKAMPSSQAEAFPWGIPAVPDYGTAGLYDSKNCVIATLASHRIRDGKTIYIYDKRLLHHKNHSRFSLYVTYFHEVVYSFARSHFKHPDSSGTRMLVSALLDESTTSENLYRTLIAGKFSEADTGDLTKSILATVHHGQLGNLLARDFSYKNVRLSITCVQELIPAEIDYIKIPWIWAAANDSFGAIPPETVHNDKPYESAEFIESVFPKFWIQTGGLGAAKAILERSLLYTETEKQAAFDLLSERVNSGRGWDGKKITTYNSQSGMIEIHSPLLIVKYKEVEDAPIYELPNIAHRPLPVVPRNNYFVQNSLREMGLAQ